MQLQLAMNKCLILHVGGTNPQCTYYMDGKPIASAKQCSDLGVTITSDLKSSTQCLKVAKTASLTAAMIHKAFSTRNRNTLLQLFKTYVRPKLENCAVIWNPYLTKDIDLIEGVQRTFTRHLPGMNQFQGQYQKRLQVLQLQPLETRRLHIDLIWVYKIINGLVALNVADFFTFSNSKTRGHSNKLYPMTCTRWLNSRFNFFSSRVVNVWNSLPKNVTNSSSLSDFKKQLQAINFNSYLKFNRNLDNM